MALVLFSRNLDISHRTIFIRNVHKHYHPKFKWLRKMKYLDSGIDFKRKITEEEKQRQMKENGVLLLRSSSEVPIYVDSSIHVFDPYVPTKGDGQYSDLATRITSSLGVKGFTLKGKNLLAVRKIRKFIENFDGENFAPTALEIYIKAHTALARNDFNELEKYTTDNAFSLMTRDTKNKTLRWKYIESLEPPRTVHVRTSSVGTEGNLFGQVTVRIFSKQTLALYDRFGRLMYGSEILAKDVLEFGVFEIHLTNINGTFKLHQKIIPDWEESRYSIIKTWQKRENSSNEGDMNAFDEYQLISDTEDEKNLSKQ